MEKKRNNVSAMHTDEESRFIDNNKMIEDIKGNQTNKKISRNVTSQTYAINIIMNAMKAATETNSDSKNIIISNNMK